MQCIPIRDLKNTAAISEMCKKSATPIFVTKNGYNDMVIMSADLDQIVSYIVEELGNPPAALSLLATVENVYEKLAETPNMYSLCLKPLLSRRGYRRVPIGGYLMIYKVDDEAGLIYIERFFSHLEDYENLL